MKLTKEMSNFYYHMTLHELRVMNGNDYYNGLSYNSILYLNVIDLMEDCTVSKIADALNISKPAVTMKLNELEKQRIIIKVKSDKDRRITYVKLSRDMEQVFSIYDRVFEKIEEKLRENYSADQLQNFMEILHTMFGYDWRSI